MIQALLQAGELRTCRRSRPMSTFCCALAKLMSLSNSLGLMACSMCVHAPHFTMMSTRHQEPGHRSRGYGLHPHCSRPHWRTRVGCAPRHASAQAACRSSPVRYAGREEGRKGGSQGAREPSTAEHICRGLRGSLENCLESSCPCDCAGCRLLINKRITSVATCETWAQSHHMRDIPGGLSTVSPENCKATLSTICASRMRWAAHFHRSACGDKLRVEPVGAIVTSSQLPTVPPLLDLVGQA